MPLDSTTQILVTVGAFAVRVWDEGTTHARIEKNGFNTHGVTHWRCAYADALPLAQALLGGSRNIGPTTTFQNGFSCAAFYGLSAQSVDITNEGVLSVDGSTGFSKWERALLEIHFGVDEFAAGDATNNSSEISMAWEFKEYPLDETTFYYEWTDDNRAIPVQDKTLRVPIGIFTKVLYNRAVLNTMAFQPYFNTVNSTPVDFTGGASPGFPVLTTPTFNFPGEHLSTGVAPLRPSRGQLYFPFPRTRTKLTPTGLPSFDLIYEFHYHPIPDGWNSLPKPNGSPSIWVPKVDINGNPEFAYADHNDLVRNF